MSGISVRKKLNSSKLQESKLKPLGLIKVECKSCKNVFGLDINFIERTSELNMRYNCPYCAVIVKDV